MEKIIVTGVSAGAGKSTFARKLGEALDLPVYHLDSYYWKPGWKEAPEEEFVNAQKEITAKEKWIIEGNYSSTLSVRTDPADTIFFINQPLYKCLYRVMKRRIQFHNKSRPDIARGCPEKLDWKFIKFIIGTYKRRKESLPEHFRKISMEDMNKSVYIFENDREMESFLMKFKRGRKDQLLHGSAQKSKLGK
ncbi:topology modulation protein [Evansella sp. LMS18]|uniref:topology modulation protein n=1 Tax=Evansella sp. LMS18 TaxID=2924033 RepID=UPI0020D0ADD1|nr:topology modulation protein [Evansella sp. LMS18]UTR09764.1 topology modulation protein [Evansella sp. LMS18]